MNWLSAYRNAKELTKYGSNALVLFALELRFPINDIDSTASESITDGSNDKKCDLIYIDKDEKLAVIAQCYYSDIDKKEAPANKASDLNTAVGWILNRPNKELPERLRPSAKELIGSIAEGSIETLNIWYVHNLPESKNVKSELITVEETAASALERQFADKKIGVQALEIGTDTLERWYSEKLSPILVGDEFELDLDHGFEVKGDKWTAFVASIPAIFLYDQYKKNSQKLFSANVRDYLGSRKSDTNINSGIKKSIQEAPDKFWAFNNGLTILVNDYSRDEKNKKLKISGISIVNGAQTTGAIGSVNRKPSKAAKVLARFIKTSENEIVHDIIQYNNSQNKITASDFRSSDKIQKRLKDEVSKIQQGLQYEAGRRGGFEDKIKRVKWFLPSYTVGQALAAVHGDPVVAYNKKSDIWINDDLYSKYFNDNTTGLHLVFAFSLVRSVEGYKQDLMDIVKENGVDNLTDEQRKVYDYFSKRGSVYLLVTAVASCLEIILNRKIQNIFRLSFGERCDLKKAIDHWKHVVEITSNFVGQLDDVFTDGLKSSAKVDAAIGRFKSLVSSTKEFNKKPFTKFAQQVLVQ